MGMVFAPTIGRSEREVALKVLGPEAARSPDLRQRFLEEAQITGQLQHPAIPPIHDRGLLPDGRAFLAMKRVKGHTLEKLLAARVWSRPPTSRVFSASSRPSARPSRTPTAGASSTVI